jgi:hypothetical protein
MEDSDHETEWARLIGQAVAASGSYESDAIQRAVTRALEEKLGNDKTLVPQKTKTTLVDDVTIAILQRVDALEKELGLDKSDVAIGGYLDDLTVDQLHDQAIVLQTITKASGTTITDTPLVQAIIDPEITKALARHTSGTEQVNRKVDEARQENLEPVAIPAGTSVNALKQLSLWYNEAVTYARSLTVAIAEVSVLAPSAENIGVVERLLATAQELVARSFPGIGFNHYLSQFSAIVDRMQLSLALDGFVSALEDSRILTYDIEVPVATLPTDTFAAADTPHTK